MEPVEREGGGQYFGWDPIFQVRLKKGRVAPLLQLLSLLILLLFIFQPSGFDISFAEMPLTEKNRISHRSLALQQFQEYIRENRETILQRLR